MLVPTPKSRRLRGSVPAISAVPSVRVRSNGKVDVNAVITDRQRASGDIAALGFADLATEGGRREGFDVKEIGAHCLIRDRPKGK